MPLPIDMETLPVHLWERWHGAHLDAERDIDQVLVWARAGTLFFWWLLLFYGWKTGESLGGTWGARLAVAFLASEPSFLAHASLATTDIAVSACVLAFVYHFSRGREGPWWLRVGVPAIWFGAAILAKASGLIFCSISLIVLELERLIRIRTFNDLREHSLVEKLRRVWQQTAALRRDFFQIVGIAILLTFLYCGSDWKSQPSFVAWANGLPDGYAKDAMVWVADNARIFSNAGEGIVRQVKHNLHGHGAYLLGRSDPRYFWYYFPVLLTVKLCVPILLLPIVLLLLEPRVLANRLGLLTATLVVFSLTWHVQIGIRLILPVIAIGLVALGAGLARAVSTVQPVWKRNVLASYAVLGLVWSGVACAAVWPNGLCYVNEIWGGTARGYRQVSDANYDWGQGLRELARWQRTNGLASLDVWYFGTDPAVKRLPMRIVPIHCLPITKFEDIESAVQTRYFAASTSLVYGAADNDDFRRAAELLRSRRPVARTSTFLIYDLGNSSPEKYSQRP
jgi:hypothetical protein